MRMLWWLPTALIVGLMTLGAGGAYLRMLAPGPGFRMFGLGILIAATSALVMSGAAALATARGWSWRGDAVRGAAVPVGISVLLLLLIATGGSHPIHDVSTDPELAFPPAIMELRPPEDHAAVLATQAQRYPDVVPLVLAELQTAAVFAAALQTAQGMPGWSVTSSDPASGRIDAVAESRIFHFADDVAIVVEPGPDGGSLVQVRSRSRIGESDLGANAARIRAYLAALQDAAGA